MVVSFLILNLMVGVICDAYSVVAEEDEDFEPPPEEDGLSYSETRAAAHAEAKENNEEAMCLRRFCQKAVASQAFENFIMAVSP